ncbi:MAG TPA: ABC transporter substrate-binding protein [Gaiellaceae bacterium]|jgi:peptide/nickel transport system substrate-binding protein
MDTKRTLRSAAGILAVAALALATAACGGGSKSTSGSNGSTPKSGGVYTVGWESSFSFTDNLDPTGEYLGDGIGILSDLLDRTLVGYNHVPGVAGNKLVPDLATSVPAPTDGGKTYTFHLKSGIKFGPPVDREITSKDVLYALERIAKPADGAQYGFYYSPIAGLASYGAGKASTISGISTPDPKTIVFHLTRPTGDFLYRMSLPATGPIPVEVAKCFAGQPGKYGNYQVSTGPYMIQGADRQNDTSCSTLKRLPGFQQTSLTLVRNPDYAPSSDSPRARQNLPDQFRFLVDSSNVDILNKIEAGQLDDEISSIPPQVLRRYVTDPNLKRSFHQNSGDRTWYLSMNLTQPPFDDVHVRKAMNWIIDKAGLRKAWGGPTVGTIANHIVPDTLFNSQLTEFAPYKTPGDHGSLTKAKAAMKGSKYSTSGNGMCDASACKNVLMISDTRGIDPGMVATIEQDARKIGITFTVHQINGAYPAIQTPSKNIPLAERPGWGKDFADAGTFFNPLFDGRTIIPSGNTNYSLVGITPAQCKTLKITGDCANVPSVNADLDHCSPMTGSARLTCYENLDRKLMTQIVPWVPYLSSLVTHITSPNVTAWSFDQFSGSIGYAHVAVGGGGASS